MSIELTIRTQQQGDDPLAVIALAGHLADSTKRQYTKAFAGYLDTGASLTDAQALAEHARTLSQDGPLSRLFRLWTEGAQKAFRWFSP